MHSRPALALVLIVVALGSATGAGVSEPRLQPPDVAALEQAVTARPDDIDGRRRLARAYEAAGRAVEAAAEWRRITERAPGAAGGWYALGHAYNAIARAAVRSFDDRPEDAPWRQLLIADGLLANGHYTDAFALYRASVAHLPALVTIHDSIAQIYERTGHPAWAARERSRAAAAEAHCATRRTLCDFRAERFDAVFAASLTGTDPESRYWRARAATALALGAFRQLESLPDSPERRAVRATVARGEQRHQDAIVELAAALKLAPGNPALTFDLASAYYDARNFAQAIETLSTLRRARPDDLRLLKLTGYALLQLRRADEALPVLEQAAKTDPADIGLQMALVRAYVHTGQFAAAIPVLEAHLPHDEDGSLHVQLARAYAGINQREKAAPLLARSQELHRVSEERKAAASRRTITPPD
jgi:predicted Zn-dependent protease